jgi:hypothetical protein
MKTKQQRDEIRKRLAEIEERNGGVLRPSDVVADARNPKSPLHDCFTWDVRKAAARYWVEQARELIVSIKVEVRVDRTQVQTVFYVKHPNSAPGEQGYVGYDRLRAQGDLAREALVQEFGRAADLLRRARELAKALELHGEVDELVSGVVGLRDRVLSASSTTQ